MGSGVTGSASRAGAFRTDAVATLRCGVSKVARARVSAPSTNRLVYRDGVPIAALEAGQVRMLETAHGIGITQIENALRVGKLAVGMRPYYG